MPYVDQKTKDRLPSYPQGARPTELPHSCGQLTYLITNQIIAYLESARQSRGVSFENLGVVEGALGKALTDFNERIVKPYEEKKREQNGDVWPADLLDAILG